MRSYLIGSLILLSMLNTPSLVNAFHPHHGKFYKGASPGFFGPNTAGMSYAMTSMSFQPATFVQPSSTMMLYSTPSFSTGPAGCNGGSATGFTYMAVPNNVFVPSGSGGCTGSSGSFSFGPSSVIADPNFIDVRTIGTVIDIAKKIREILGKDGLVPSPTPPFPGTMDQRLTKIENELAQIKAGVNLLLKKQNLTPTPTGPGGLPQEPPQTGTFSTQDPTDSGFAVPDDFTKALQEYHKAINAYGGAAQAAKIATKAHQNAEIYNKEQAEILLKIKTSLDKINKGIAVSSP